MYLEHFGLKEFPFTLTPNTEFFQQTPQHRAVLKTTLAALSMGEGFVKIVGEVGSGKTMLCRKLLKSLPEHIVTASIPNPLLTPTQLFFTLADELYVQLPERPTPHQLVKAITTKLLGLRRRKKNVVLLIDEAQAMPINTLEALRLLTNLETEDSKLLQIVLFGQPELDDKLRNPKIRQLVQRISFCQTLEPLPTDRESVRSYLQHRMDIAGYVGNAPFHRSAVAQITKASQGIPRVINILAHKALIACMSDNDDTVRKSHAVLAIRDSRSVIDSTKAYRSQSYQDIAEVEL